MLRATEVKTLDRFPGLRTELDLKVPRHIAIVMDGNGRWAEQRGYPRYYGHVRGSRVVSAVVRACGDLGVEALTLYAFSSENWRRPAAERVVLWKLLRKYLVESMDELDRHQVQLCVIGDLERLDQDLRELILRSTERLQCHKKLKLTFAISYGGRNEIVEAGRAFAKACLKGRWSPDELSESLFERFLMTGEGADVDLLIRTSGEMRISNFLLWQLAYAEMVFMDTLWPDFSAEHLLEAVKIYSTRERRYGSLHESEPKTVRV
jgi:undecaprenyl diphosphate synthase